jgi:hypothetical protein
MAIVDIGMTQEQVLAAIAPAPAGRYRLVFKGFIKDKDGSIKWPTKKGGEMYKAKFEVVSPDPALAGKGIIYNAVRGAFTFATLVKLLPIMTASGIDTEAAIGCEVEADLSIHTYTNPDTGKESEPSNQIDKLLAV